MATSWKKFTKNLCDMCGQMPCDEHLETCPFAIAIYLIVSRDDELCQYIGEYLSVNQE